MSTSNKTKVSAKVSKGKEVKAKSTKASASVKVNKNGSSSNASVVKGKEVKIGNTGTKVTQNKDISGTIPGASVKPDAKAGVTVGDRIVDTDWLNNILDELSAGAQVARGKEVNVADNSAQTDALTNIIANLKVNNLDSYVTPQLRADYIRDRGEIQKLLDDATNKAFDVQRAQAVQDALKAEDTNYRNTRNAISELRRNLIGSASSGANIGAANATALQALLGLGQQNTDVTTEGLRNISNVSKERAAQLAQNASDAITAANEATSKMYDAATSAYGSDRSYAAQGAAEALGNIRSTDITSASNERMNDATNSSQERIANIQAAVQKAVANIEAAAQKEVAATPHVTVSAEAKNKVKLNGKGKVSNSKKKTNKKKTNKKNGKK